PAHTAQEETGSRRPWPVVRRAQRDGNETVEAFSKHCGGTRAEPAVEPNAAPANGPCPVVRPMSKSRDGERARMHDVSVELIVLDDEPATTERAGRFLADAARAGGHIALSGGKSPEHAHETAAELQPDWSGVELWWGDER